MSWGGRTDLMGWDSDVLMLVSVRGCVGMDSERAFESSRCSSGCDMDSPAASAAHCFAAGMRGLARVAAEQGHQRTWSAYFCWQSRRARTASGRCRESGVYETGQPGGMGERGRGGARGHLCGHILCGCIRSCGAARRGGRASRVSATRRGEESGCTWRVHLSGASTSDMDKLLLLG